MLGVGKVRGNIKDIVATEYIISFKIGKVEVSGVYFLPESIDIISIYLTLYSLEKLSLILGDINTRFRDPK